MTDRKLTMSFTSTDAFFGCSFDVLLSFQNIWNLLHFQRLY